MFCFFFSFLFSFFFSGIKTNAESVAGKEITHEKERKKRRQKNELLHLDRKYLAKLHAKEFQLKKAQNDVTICYLDDVKHIFSLSEIRSASNYSEYDNAMFVNSRWHYFHERKFHCPACHVTPKLLRLQFETPGAPSSLIVTASVLFLLFRYFRRQLNIMTTVNFLTLTPPSGLAHPVSKIGNIRRVEIRMKSNKAGEAVTEIWYVDSEVPSRSPFLTAAYVKHWYDLGI